MQDINLIRKDIGPGNCLIDEWIRRNKKGNYDKNGEIASQGKTNKLILDQALDDFENIPAKSINSFDVNDFEINFLRGLDLEDGASTITDFTSKIISNNLIKVISKHNQNISKIILCGGGRKNKTLVSNLKSLVNHKFYKIDDFNIDGDFIESQAFAYLSVRSLYKKNISFPETTKINKPLSGGELITFF